MRNHRHTPDEIRRRSIPLEQRMMICHAKGGAVSSAAARHNAHNETMAWHAGTRIAATIGSEAAASQEWKARLLIEAAATDNKGWIGVALDCFPIPNWFAARWHAVAKSR